MDDPTLIAAGLTKAARGALINAQVCDDGGAQIVCRALYPPTITALERRKLIQFNGFVTPLGLAVRTILAGEPK